MAYDFRKWSEASRGKHRRRSRWLRWYLLLGLLMMLPIPIADTIMQAKNHNALALTAQMLLPLLLGMSFTPFARSPWLTARGREQFDEFEQAAMYRATVAAYATLLVIVLVGMIWLWLASLMRWPAPSTPLAWSAWALFLFGAGMALPVTYAEWMVPLPPSEPFEDDGELL